MIKVAEGSKQAMLQHLMRLNPFHVIIACKKRGAEYLVEAVNQKAVLLFGNPMLNMPAAQYLENKWSALLPFLQKELAEIVPVNLFDQEDFMLHRHRIYINDEEYLFIILQEKMTVQQVSYEDSLTGLSSFRTLEERWNVLLEENDRYKLALIIVDIDRFKKFNESLGKSRADFLLISMAQRFRKLHSERYEVFRLNGDKFLYAMQYENKRELELLIANIYRLFEEPVNIEEQDYYLTISIGIATSTLMRKPKLDQLLHEAEQALAYVKEHERHNYRFFSKEMSNAFPNEALMEAHLRRAIEYNELFLHFQPQKNLQTGGIDSFEALIRWKNRKFGIVSPGQFIPLAESSGLILPIGHWVLETVCRYMQEWQRKGYRPVRVAVNISPKQFKQLGFANSVRELIEKYEIPPSLIELEITESSMMNEKETTRILKELKELGVYVSVDDFGTGYSSLSYLKAYPIDIIKIDQSFIADIEKDEKNEAIVRAIILLSHTLGLEVIAEGVEEERQEQFLMANHCQKVQGFLYNRPLPVEEIIDQYLLN